MGHLHGLAIRTNAQMQCPAIVYYEMARWESTRNEFQVIESFVVPKVKSVLAWLPVAHERYTQRVARQPESGYPGKALFDPPTTTQ